MRPEILSFVRNARARVRVTRTLGLRLRIRTDRAGQRKEAEKHDFLTNHAY
jgi:hypothetical protein